MTRGGSADMSSFCVAAVLGASSWWFATRVRSARGTDRDTPASFPRSRSSRIVFSPKPKLAAVARETNEKDAFPGPPVCGIKDSAGGSEARWLQTGEGAPSPFAFKGACCFATTKLLHR